MTGSEKRGYIYVFLTGVFFALEVIGFKEVFRRTNLPPEIAALYGVGFCFFLLLPYFLYHKTRRKNIILTLKRDGKILTLGTVSNAIGIVLYYFALKQTDLGPAAVLIKTTAIYNVLLGFFFLNERLKAVEVFGIGIALFGIYLISTLQGQINLISALSILASAFFFAIQSYLIKRFIPNILGIEYAFLRLFLLSIFFLAYSTINSSLLIPSANLVLILGSLSFLGYFLGRAFYFEAHNHLPISKLNSTLLIEPIFLMAIGIVFLKEPIDFQKIVGALSILLGLYLIVFHRSKEKPKNQTEKRILK